MKKLLPILLLLGATPPAHASVTCSSSYCVGPANELIGAIRTTGSSAFMQLSNNSSSLGCGPAGTKQVDLGTGATQSARLAMLLSALAMNHTVRVTVSGTSLSCSVSILETQVAPYSAGGTPPPGECGNPPLPPCTQ